MRDEIDGRLWAAHGRHLGSEISAFLHRFGKGLARLHAIGWDAPWKHSPGKRSSAGLA